MLRCVPRLQRRVLDARQLSGAGRVLDGYYRQTARPAVRADRCRRPQGAGPRGRRSRDRHRAVPGPPARRPVPGLGEPQHGLARGRAPPSSCSPTTTRSRSRGWSPSTSSGTTPTRTTRSPSWPRALGEGARGHAVHALARRRRPVRLRQHLRGHRGQLGAPLQRELVDQAPLPRARRGYDEERLPYLYEDIDWGYRAKDHGLRVLYNRRAIVDHWRPMTLDVWKARAPMLAATEWQFTQLHPDVAPVVPPEVL